MTISVISDVQCSGSIVPVETAALESNKIEFKLFPNPTSSSFNLTNSEFIQSIQILDAQGRLQMQSESLPMDVSKMAHGFYWVKIETLTGEVFTEKLVVE